MKNRKGFTLIELLVVIATIALLLSIMMPSLARAKAIAERVICMTNMKNIGYALMMYADANDGKSVLATFGGPEYSDDMQGKLGFEVLDPYMGITTEDRENLNNSPWVCRTALKRSKHSLHLKRWGTTYGWNGNAIPYSVWDGAAFQKPDVILKLSRIRYTTQCMYIGDAHWADTMWVADPKDAYWLEMLDSFYWGTPEMQHLGGANFAFFDGHMEYRKEEDIPMGCEPGEGDPIDTGWRTKKDKFWFPWGVRSWPRPGWP